MKPFTLKARKKEEAKLVLVLSSIAGWAINMFSLQLILPHQFWCSGINVIQNTVNVKQSFFILICGSSMFSLHGWGSIYATTTIMILILRLISISIKRLVFDQQCPIFIARVSIRGFDLGSFKMHVVFTVSSFPSVVLLKSLHSNKVWISISIEDDKICFTLTPPYISLNMS